MSTADFWERAIKEEWATPDSAKARTASLNEDQLRRRSLFPDKTPDLFEATDAGKSPFLRDNFDNTKADNLDFWWTETQGWNDDQRRDSQRFSEGIERAFHYGGGKVSLEWLVEQDPQDLALLNSGDYGIDQEVLELVSRMSGINKDFQDDQARLEAEREAFIENHVKTTQRTRGVLANLPNIIPGIGDVLETGIEMSGVLEGELAGMTQEEREVFLTKQGEEMWEQHLADLAEDAEPATPGFWQKAGYWVGDQFTNIFTMVGESIGAGLEQVAIGQQIGGPLNNTRGESFRYTTAFERAELNNERAKAAIDAEFGSDLAIINNAIEHSSGDLRNLWNDPEAMEELMPGVRQEQIEMFGGDEKMAGISFVMAGQDALLTSDEQVLLDLGTEIYDMQIENMQEDDYRVTGWLLNALGAFDKYGPSQLGTGLLILLSDEDYNAKDLVTKWGEFHNEIVESDYRPSKVFGIEDTLGGFGLDMGVSIGLDPTNIFVPPGVKAAGRLRSAKSVDRMLDRGPVAMYLDDGIQAIAKGDIAGIHTSLGWLMEADPHIYDEILGMVSRSSDELGDVIGPNVNVEQSNRLRELAEKGVPPSKGVDSGVGAALEAEATGRLNSNNLSKIKLVDAEDTQEFHFWHEGNRYEPRFFSEGGQKGILWSTVDAEGNNVLGGMVRWNTDGSPGAGWVSKVPREAKLVESTIEIIRRGTGMGNGEVAKLLLASADDTSITVTGAKAVTREVRKFVDETAGGVGKALVREMDEATKGHVKELVKQALLDGASPEGMRRNAMAMAMGNKVKKAVDSGDLNTVGRYFQHFRTNRIFRTGSGTAYKEFTDTIHYLWNDNREMANLWTQRMVNARRRSAQAAVRMAEDPDFIRLREIAKEAEEVAGKLAKEGLDEMTEAGLQAMDNRLWQEMNDLKDTVARRYIHDLRDNPLEKMIPAMWDDFNREVLAKMPQWKPHVNSKGMVPWEVLRGPGGASLASEIVPEGMEGLLLRSGDDARKVLDVDAPWKVTDTDLARLEAAIDGRVASQSGPVTVPLSTFDMVVASSEKGADFLAQLHKRQWMDTVRRQTHNMDRIWKLDKIARVSTAGVVSFDELLRVFHVYGNEAAWQYIRDRAMFAQARGKAIRAGKLNKKYGREDLSPAQKERLRELDNIPSYINEAEMLTYDRIGSTVRVIENGDPGYRSAAREFYRYYAQDPGLHAALKGKQSFMTWWESDAALDYRKAAILANDTGNAVNAVDAAWLGYQNVLEVLTRGMPTIRKRKTLNALRDAAEDVARGGNGYLPDEILAYTPSVKGYQRAGFDSGRVDKVLNGATEFMLDSFFMEPTNYRRGLLYNIAHKKEMERLYGLYASQDIRVISDAEFISMLGLPEGYSLASMSPDVVDQLARSMGRSNPADQWVLERTLSNRAGSYAQDEMQNLFYAWDEGSRFGQSAKNVAPFGGPWADMWGFWGREMLTRPYLRGNLDNNRFLAGLQSNLFDKMPVNPRTLETVSRAANQDLSFEIGETEIDLSPLVFFPTRDENPLMTMTPGLGYFPMELIDGAIELFGDPVNDPAGYQKLQEEIGKYIPQVEFQGGGFLTDIASGGNAAFITKLITNIYGSTVGRNKSAPWLNTYSDDIDLNRAVSADLVPAIEDLLTISDPDDLKDQITAILTATTRKQSRKEFGQNATRWIIPARVEFDPAVDELHEVWIDWAKNSKDVIGIEIPNIDSLDGESARRLSADIREYYFDMPQEKRDLAILQNPALAVNVVGNWVWSDEGISQFDEEALTPYRAGGSDEDILKHQTYVDKGWIKPILPIQKAYITLGVVQTARERAAKNVYSSVVTARNDSFWGIVEPAVTPFLESMLPMVEPYGIKDAKTLWTKMSGMQDEYEGQLLQSWGIDPDSQVGQLLQSDMKNFPPKLLPWGTNWRRGPRKDFNTLNISTVDLPDEVIEAMGLIGIDYDPSLTGAQLHQGVEDFLGSTPGFNVTTKSPYQAYLTPMGAESQTAKNELINQAETSKYDFEYRSDIYEFMDYADNINDAMIADGYRNRVDVDSVREKFMSLMNRSQDPSSFETIWNMAYESKFGPLDWEAPTPPDLFDENGHLNSRAYQPVIRKIEDGDTIVVNHSETFFDAQFRGSRVTLDNDAAGIKSIRLVGVRARDYGIDDDGAREDEAKLREALLQAKQNGSSIYLVTDPDQIGGNTDRYGRELAWLYIDGEPWFSDDAFLPTD